MRALSLFSQFILWGNIALVVSSFNANPGQTSLKLNSIRKLHRFNAGARLIPESLPELTNFAVHCSHWLPVDDCLNNLKVSEKSGLLSVEASSRLLKYGPNALSKATSKSLFSLVLEQLSDKLVQILLSVATLSAVIAAFEKDLHAFAEPLIILTILVINAFVSIWQSKSAEDSLEALNRLQPDSANVLRDGVWKSDFPTALLVPGDIISLRVGDKVPADARIVRLTTNNFNTDEGSLTGESKTVAKSTQSVSPNASITDKLNMVFSGTMVTNGACVAVVTSTGALTEIGKINEGVEVAKLSQSKTPLAEQLDVFGDQLTKVIAGICGLVWVSSIPKFSNFKTPLAGAVYYAKVAVALGVAAIPEGLPAVITMCLSLGTKRMAKRNVIVRKLSSVETLGCTSVICTDKTGTLTTNKMTVKSIVTFKAPEVAGPDGMSLADKLKPRTVSGSGSSGSSLSLVERHVEGVSYDPIGEVQNMQKFGTAGASAVDDIMKGTAQDTLHLFTSICSLCNEARIEFKDGAYTRVGEPTEAALKVLVEKLGPSADHFTASTEPAKMATQYSDFIAEKFDVLSILEFNRDRKSMSVLVRPKAVSSGYYTKKDNFLFVKGASEMVVARCNRVQLEDGSIVPITAEIRSELNQKCHEMARRPLRCLALAYKTGNELGALNSVSTAEEASKSPLLSAEASYADIESDMVLVGFTAITDPARPEAAEAIKTCSKAGIRVMMITGDSKETAVAIAKDVNIFPRDLVDTSECAFTGKEFFALPEARQLELLKTGNKVFCRAEPRDKQRLISQLSHLGEVTAMTGDGVNDAPALQQADIGIAMGITGTEVAKSAADMVLADDNFATIVSAVEEGRNIYANMQSFVSFLISCNIGEIFTVLLATLLGLPEMLSPMHLLWVNLVTDGPPATALGYNPADKEAMNKLPRRKTERIMSPWLGFRYGVTGLYVGTATVLAYMSYFWSKGVTTSELMNWQDCSKWTSFMHSADAPHLPSQACDIFSKAKYTAVPQTMALSVLVAVELLKALSAVSLQSSLLSVSPLQNPALMLGVAVPFAIHLTFMYVPLLSKVLGLAPLTKAQWKTVALCSLPILLLEEVLKFVGRGLGARREKQLQAERVQWLNEDDEK